MSTNLSDKLKKALEEHADVLSQDNESILARNITIVGDITITINYYNSSSTSKGSTPDLAPPRSHFSS